jgi:hypothetical protein
MIRFKDLQVLQKQKEEELQKKRKKELEAEQQGTKTILFVSHSTGAGRGDFDYLIQLSDKKFLREHGLAIDSFKIKRLFSIAASSDCKDFLKKECELRDESTDFTYFEYLTGKERREKIKEYLTANRDVGHIIVVSTPEILDKDWTTPATFIGAHGSKLINNQVTFENDAYYIGERDGFLMPDTIVKPGHTLARAACLDSLEEAPGNYSYLNMLRGDRSSADFLNQNLLIPGYFQNKDTLALFLNGISRSQSLHKDYNEGVTFHLSLHKTIRDEIKISDKMFALIVSETLKVLRELGFSKISIIMGTDNRGVPNTPCEFDIPDPTGSKCVRIISHIYLENKKDFDSLYGAAQVLGSSSGDNTLNNAYAKGLLSFHPIQIHNDLHLALIKKFFKTELGLNSPQFEKLVDAMFPRVGDLYGVSKDAERLNTKATQFAISLNGIFEKDSFVVQLNTALSKIPKDYNFQSSMKQICTKLNPTLTNETNKSPASQEDTQQSDKKESTFFGGQNKDTQLCQKRERDSSHEKSRKKKYFRRPSS